MAVIASGVIHLITDDSAVTSGYALSHSLSHLRGGRGLKLVLDSAPCQEHAVGVKNSLINRAAVCQLIAE